MMIQGLTSLLNGLAWISMVILVLAGAMVTLNALFAGRLRHGAKPIATGPLVSVLIPVRNEAENLPRLLPALLASSFRNFEIIVLDDESTDGSFELARSILVKANIPVRLEHGRPWSQELGLSGKAHACAQLAENAHGEILLFCDADVLPSPDAIGLTVSHMTKPEFHDHSAGLTALPHQICHGLRERLLIPWIMHLPIMASLPFFCSWRFPLESMQLANGQWLAIFARDYHASGGHRQLGATPLDDVTLARIVKKTTGRGIRPVLASSDLAVNMYKDWNSMLAGFAKNLVAIGGGNPWLFALMILLVNLVFMIPLWGWLVRPGLILPGLACCLLIRVITAKTFKMPLRDLLLHPVSLVLLDIAAWSSVLSSLRGAYEWKGRVMKWSTTQ